MDSRRELLAIEETLWRAAGDRAGWGKALAADAMHVFPGPGLLDRESILDGVEHAEPWQAFRIEDPRVIALDDGCAALVYRADAERAGRPTLQRLSPACIAVATRPGSWSSTNRHRCRSGSPMVSVEWASGSEARAVL